MVHDGESLKSISQRLYQTGLISSERLFRWGMLLNRRSREFKVGDYFISARQSPYDIAHLLMTTQCDNQKITIPEGLTNYQVFQLLKSKAFLKDDHADIPPEGMMYPETYIFAKGTKISRVVEEMVHNMRESLQDLWGKRQKDLPLKSPEEALILASIVEREASFNSEKPKIAGVYINRLNRRMALQADPTVIYCVTDGTGNLGRTLIKSDMSCEGKFNTYTHKGLPPTPISNPSLASLKAVLIHPEKTDALYFVADGRGGHRFSKNYKTHRQNIRKLKRHLKKR